MWKVWIRSIPGAFCFHRTLWKQCFILSTIVKLQTVKRPRLNWFCISASGLNFHSQMIRESVHFVFNFPDGWIRFVLSVRRNISGLPELVEEAPRSHTQNDSAASGCRSADTNTHPPYLFGFCVENFKPTAVSFQEINVFPQKQSVTFPYPHIMKSMYQEMSLFGNKWHFDLKMLDVCAWISGLQSCEHKNEGARGIVHSSVFSTVGVFLQSRGNKSYWCQLSTWWKPKD